MLAPMMSDWHRESLDRRGFVQLPAALPIARCARLVDRLEQLYASEGERAGSEFRQEPGARRLANLVDKDRPGDPLFASCIDHPGLVPYVAAVIPDRFKLSSLNARSANPGNQTVQPLHADGGALPDARGFWVCNLLLMLDDFTADNGALRVVPGTHRSGCLPADALADAHAPHPDQVMITGQVGDVLVLNSHCWHGGLANHSAHPRRALHLYYCRWDKPQQQYQRRLLSAETQARLTPGQRAMCALDDPDNDRLSGADSGHSGFLK
jgi:ectoine hydroxylase-related dioxygenase (phytanoyl-CoA dioxygenase family)